MNRFLLTQNIFLIGLTVTGFTVLVVIIVLNARFNQYQKLFQEKKQLRKALFQKQKKAKINYYQQEISRLTRLYQKEISLYSQTRSESDLMVEISKIAIDSGLIVDFFAPVLQKFPKTGESFFLKIIVSGRYLQLATFISRLAKLNNLLNFEEFEIEKQPNSKQSLIMKLKMSITHVH